MLRKTNSANFLGGNHRTAATAEAPLIPDPVPFQEMTALQKHCAFFDINSDGWITLSETYRGLRDLGIARSLSAVFAAAINAALGWSTSPGLLPTLTIDLRRIHRGKHGSDTGVYDRQGNFVPERFEHLFSRWDRNRDNALDAGELLRRLYDEHYLWDVTGIVASTGEWGLLYAIAAEHGKLSRETVRRMFDGTLFYDLAARRGVVRPQPWS